MCYCVPSAAAKYVTRPLTGRQHEREEKTNWQLRTLATVTMATREKVISSFASHDKRHWAPRGRKIHFHSLSLFRVISLRSSPPPSDSLPGALSSFSFVEGALLHTKASIISIDNKGMCVTFVQLLLSFPLCALAPLKNDKIFQAVNRLEKEKTPEATRCCATDHRESLPEVVTNTARLAYTLRAKKPKSNLLPVLMVGR